LAFFTDDMLSCIFGDDRPKGSDCGERNHIADGHPRR